MRRHLVVIIVLVAFFAGCSKDVTNTMEIDVSFDGDNTGESCFLVLVEVTHPSIVDHIELFVSDSFYDTLSITPFISEVCLPLGQYQSFDITAYAYDEAQDLISCDTLNIDYAGISINSPESLSVASFDADIRLNVFPEDQMTDVEFYVGDSLIDVVSEPPFNLNIDFYESPIAKYEVYAIGNISDYQVFSDTITVIRDPIDYEGWVYCSWQISELNIETRGNVTYRNPFSIADSFYKDGNTFVSDTIHQFVMSVDGSSISYSRSEYFEDALNVRSIQYETNNIPRTPDLWDELNPYYYSVSGEACEDYIDNLTFSVWSCTVSGGEISCDGMDVISYSADEQTSIKARIEFPIFDQ